MSKFNESEDYKVMYYRLLGQIGISMRVLDSTVEILDGTSEALKKLRDDIKAEIHATNDMYWNGSDCEGTEEK